VQTHVYSLSQLVPFISLAPPACAFSPVIPRSDNTMIVATSDIYLRFRWSRMSDREKVKYIDDRWVRVAYDTGLITVDLVHIGR